VAEEEEEEEAVRLWITNNTFKQLGHTSHRRRSGSVNTGFIAIAQLHGDGQVQDGEQGVYSGRDGKEEVEGQGGRRALTTQGTKGGHQGGNVSE